VKQRVATTAELLEDDGEGADSAQIADEFGDWLIGYFQLVSSHDIILQIS
jgi:hypothetical protein